MTVGTGHRAGAIRWQRSTRRIDLRTIILAEANLAQPPLCSMRSLLPAGGGVVSRA